MPRCGSAFLWIRAVHQARIWRFLWRLYTRIGLPLAGRAVSPSWGAVGDFLGPSIERFYSIHSQAKLECHWRAAGLDTVTVRTMSLGGGTVMSANKSERITRAPPQTANASRAQAPANTASAFYALRPGGWRDYWTLMYPPYTAWHLSYVLLGAALAPAPDPRIVIGALLAFGLAVGIGAHAFDELQGRPLGTRIPSPVLLASGVTALGLAAALGIVASTTIGTSFLAIVVLGVLLVAAYGFEISPVHSDVGFALAWGAFPCWRLRRALYACCGLRLRWSAPARWALIGCSRPREPGNPPRAVTVYWVMRKQHDNIRNPWHYRLHRFSRHQCRGEDRTGVRTRRDLPSWPAGRPPAGLVSSS